MPQFESHLLTHQATLTAAARWRTLPSPPANVIADFSHNDYLGLAQDPAIIAAANACAEQYGIGATGSRLLSGNLPPHQALEQRIAADKGTEAALIFSSGYQANATVLAALLDKQAWGAEPLLFTDRLNHASLHHACQLMGVHQLRYRHNDLDHLREWLARHQGDARPKFVVTESVFGMDGDVIDMAALAAIADEHDAFLYVDEAHATGVLGQDGYGLAAGLVRGRGLAMGTFSKALGGSGAYIACSAIVRDHLVNRCTGFIYSTAMSPALVGAAHAAWQRLPELGAQREQLTRTAQRLRERLQALGFDTGASSTHIVPIIVGADAAAVALKQALFERGIVVSAIRPPTVPPHGARLRIALSVTHTPQQIDALIAALTDARATLAAFAKPDIEQSTP